MKGPIDDKAWAETLYIQDLPSHSYLFVNHSDCATLQQRANRHDCFQGVTNSAEVADVTHSLLSIQMPHESFKSSFGDALYDGCIWNLYLINILRMSSTI